MAQSIAIPWNDGAGNIILTYNGQGDGSVTVTSDTDNLGTDRQQVVTFVVTDGAIRNVIQTSGGNQIRTSDGHILRSLDNSMKVQVLVIQPTGMRVIVTSSDHMIRTINGNILRCHPTTNG